MRLFADAYVSEHHPVSPDAEAKAAKLRAEVLAVDGKPEGTVEALVRCATMLNTHAPDCFPANEHGQIHFARAMMESVADEITAFVESAAVVDVARERQRIRGILWKTPMPGDWSEQAQRYVTYMVAEFDKLICRLDDVETAKQESAPDLNTPVAE
jgi:hypothetical protein